MIAALALCAALAAPAAAASAPAAPPAAAPATAAAEEARRLYDSGRYAEAADAYARLVQASPRSAALDYDLGDALFKAGRYGRATASFERAFSLDPRDRDVRHNLQFTLKRAGEDLVPPGTPPALFQAFTALSERELAGLQWLAAWAALLLVSAILLSGPARRRTLAPWAAGAAGVWLVFALWWAGLRSILPPDRGVIVAARAEVRHGPGESFGVAFTVPEGRRVRVLSADGGWLEVGVLKEGARGWLPAADVERL